jgi:hypothetical protein
MDRVDDLRGAARRALEQMGEAPEQAGAKVQRVVIDVTIDGRTEMVTMSLRDGELSWSSSDGQRRGPHVVEALRLLAAGATALPKGVRTSPGDIAAADSLGASLAPEAPGEGRTSDPEQRPMKQVLADQLDDLVTAITRVGVREARESATVKEAVERLAQTVGQPMPLGVARSLGRLRNALSRMNVDRVARSLESACRLADDLRSPNPSERSRRRIVSWLGPDAAHPKDIERISDRTLIEVGREYLSGTQRAYVDRRYLLCCDSGEVFREERGRGAPHGSVGPSPRVLTVGLGEVAECAEPRSIRLLQYAISNQISRDISIRIDEAAKTNFNEIIESYRESLDRYPGLAEPFVLLAPQRIETEPGTHLVDRDGTTIPLSRADGLGRTQALLEILNGHRLDWIAGRMVDAEGSPILVPCGIGYRDDGVRRIRRLS